MSRKSTLSDPQASSAIRKITDTQAELIFQLEKSKSLATLPPMPTLPFRTQSNASMHGQLPTAPRNTLEPKQTQGDMQATSQAAQEKVPSLQQQATRRQSTSQNQNHVW